MKYEIINNVMFIKNWVTEISQQDIENLQFEKVVLSKNLKTIESFTFYNKGLKEVEFNDCLVTIDKYAFAGNNLEFLNLPDSVRKIGVAAFYGNKINNLKLPLKLIEMESKAFEKNYIEKVEIPFLVSEIKANTFKSNQLKEIVLNNNISKIENYAFAENQLENVEIANNDAYIGKYAFYNNKIKSLNLPNSISVIKEGAFMKNKLTNVNIPNSVTKIEDEAFSFNKIKNLKLSDNIFSIGESTFEQNCIKNLTLPDSLCIISKKSFLNNNIDALTLPENLKIINEEAFMNNNIQTLIFNKKLKAIGNNAFMNNKLETINVKAEVINDEAFSFNPLSKVYIDNKNIKLGNNVFSTEELIVDNLVIKSNVLNRFNSRNLSKIITFMENIKDYDLMNVASYELELMPNDKEIFKQYKSNYKKYNAILKESKIKKTITTFKMAFLLGIFKDPKKNIKEFLMYTYKFDKHQLIDLFSHYSITKYNKKLTDIAISFINNEADLYIPCINGSYIKNERNLNILKEILENYEYVFEKIYIHKKDKLSKNNTKKLKLEKENIDTKELNELLKYQKLDLKKVSYDDVVDYFKSTAFEINEGNDRLKEITLFLSSYIGKNEFNIIQDIYEKRTTDDELYFKNFKGFINDFEYEWLPSEDPTNFILGYLVNCCSKIGGLGEDIMTQSVVNPRIKNLVIKKNDKIVAKSTAYYNEDYILCNNIEVKRSFHNKNGMFEVFVEALTEQARHLNIEKVNIGLINNDLLMEIENSDYKIINKDLLKNYKYSKYLGDAYYEQVKILK